LDAQILSRCKKPKYTLGPRLDATVRLFRGLTGHKATFASLEVSPPRPVVARHISASPKGEGSPSERRRTPSHSRPPRPSPPQGLGAGELRLVRDPPRQTRAISQLPDGTGTFIANHSTAWSGSQTASAATWHSGHDRSPLCLLLSLCLYSRCCVDLRRVVRTCLALHHHSRRHAHSATQREPPTVLSRFGEKRTTLEITRACNPSLLESIKGGGELPLGGEIGAHRQNTHTHSH